MLKIKEHSNNPRTSSHSILWRHSHGASVSNTEQRNLSQEININRTESGRQILEEQERILELL